MALAQMCKRFNSTMTTSRAFRIATSERDVMPDGILVLQRSLAEAAFAQR
jgi:hypothetical protein